MNPGGIPGAAPGKPGGMPIPGGIMPGGKAGGGRAYGIGRAVMPPGPAPVRIFTVSMQRLHNRGCTYPASMAYPDPQPSPCPAQP